MATIYGIKACDTMQKARRWLADHAAPCEFHDYKSQGVDRARLEAWVRRLGWESLLNRSGTTFRKLPDAEKLDLTEAKAIDLMVAQPSMIRRPVLETETDLIVGFKPEIYAARLG